jgi:hypothetical protein
MESKFIIFVAFVATQSISLVHADITLPDLTSIEEYQAATVAGKYNGLNHIFDYVTKNTAATIYGGDAATDDSSAVTAYALAEVTAAIDAILSAIKLALPEECSTFDETAEAAYPNVETLFAWISQGIALAESEDYNVSEMDEAQAEVKALLGDWVEAIYTTGIVGCLNPADGLKTVIEEAKESAATNMKNTATAVMNSFKIYGDVRSGSIQAKDLTALTAIEFERFKALRGVRGEVTYTFGAIKTMKINNENEVEDGDVSGIRDVMSNEILSNFRLNLGSDSLHEAIVRYLTRVDLGLVFGNPDISIIKLAAASQSSDFSAANEAIFEAVESDEAKETLRTTFVDANEKADSAFVEIVQLIFTSNEDIVSQIEDKRTNVASVFSTATGTLFDTISSSNAEDLTTYEDTAIAYATEWADTVIDKLLILADAVSAGEVTDEGFDQMKSLQSAGKAAIEGYTKTIAAAFVTTIC